MTGMHMSLCAVAVRPRVKLKARVNHRKNDDKSDDSESVKN